MGGMIKEMCEDVVEVRMASDWVMPIALAFNEDVMKLIHGYAPKYGRCLEENEYFHELRNVWNMLYADELSVCLGNLNRCLVRHIHGFS